MGEVAGKISRMHPPYHEWDPILTNVKPGVVERVCKHCGVRKLTIIEVNNAYNEWQYANGMPSAARLKCEPKDA